MECEWTGGDGRGEGGGQDRWMNEWMDGCVEEESGKMESNPTAEV